MRITKKITSIVLAVLMVVSMMSVMAVSASAADYVDDTVRPDDFAAGDTLSATSGNYLGIYCGGYSVIFKGGTYRERLGFEAQANDLEFQKGQIDNIIITGDYNGPRLLVKTDSDETQEYYPLDAEGNVSDKWYVLSADHENLTVTLAGHAPAAPVDYYIVGTMNNWETSDAYKLDKNPENNGEYMFKDLKVSANTELKVKDSNGAFYPDGMGNNFTLNAAGTYDLYFRPDGQGGGLWYYGTIYANNYREPVYVAQIGSTKYESLEKAVAAAQAGDTVKLLDTVTLTESLVIPEGKDFTLDLNGKDITGNVNDKLVKNNGTVVVDDSTAAPGHIYNTNIDKQGNAAFVNYGTATVKNGYFGDKNSDQTDANDVNRGAGFQNQGTAVIDGGYFTACDNFTPAEKGNNGYAYAIINYGNITINDATVYGKNNGNLANDEGTMVVNGGTYTLNKPAKKNVYYSIYNGSADANTTVNAGTFTNNGTKALLYTGEGSTEVKGGTFTGPKIEQSTSAPAISGGTFNKAVPEEYCAEGMMPVVLDETTGTYTVDGPYAAKIGDTGYATLKEAITAAQDGDTVKLLSSVTEIATINGKTLTLDLNGFNITSTSKKAPVRAENGAKLTIVNSNTDKAENTATQNAIMGPTGSNNYGSVSANGEGTTVDIYAGYYYGYNGNKTAVNALNGATVTFWGGTVNGAAGIDDSTAGKEGKVFYSGVSNPTKPYATTPGYIIVHGGNFSGRMSDSNWGNYLIDGGTFDRNEVVLNENPVDGDGNRVATAKSSMTSIGTGTLAEAGWLADGFIPKDNGDGTYTVVRSNPLDAPITKADDGNKFGINSQYLAGTLLGVQKKDAIADADVTSESHQESGNDIRFVAVLDTKILQDAEDYGFVLAKANTKTKYSDVNFDNLKAHWGNGEKTISAKNTYNNVCGTTEDAQKYGDPTDDTTDYKYITCAVNGMSDDDMVVARFYVVIGGKTYYAKYAGHNYKYTGCMTKADLVPVAD